MSGVRLSFRLLDVLDDVQERRHELHDALMTHQYEFRDWLRIDDRLLRVVTYIRARVRREYDRRPFCMNCGYTPQDPSEPHTCEPDLSCW